MDKDIEFVVELWMAIQKRREDSMKDCPQELAGYSPEKQEATQQTRRDDTESSGSGVHRRSRERERERERE